MKISFGLYIYIAVGNFPFVVCNIFVLIRLLVARSHCCDSCACMHRSCSGCNKGMMNSEKYLDVLTKRVILDMARKFPEVSGIFQQDLAPCHTSQKVKNFINLNNISGLDWPGNSPDLNPIENFWSIIKIRLRRRDCITTVKLIEAIINCRYRDPQIQENCKKLINLMPKRVKSVLTSCDGHIRY